MTKQEKTLIKKSIVREVRKILLADTFADDKFDLHATLYDLSTFKEADFVLIKKDVAKKFGLNISQDISGLTVIDLCSLIFVHICNSPDLAQQIIESLPIAHHKEIKIETPAQQPAPKKTSDESKKDLLNSHQVCSVVMLAIGEIMNRRISSGERVSKIKEDFYAQNDGADFDRVLMDNLQSKFNLPIQIITDTQSNPKMGVYHITTQTMEALIDCGKAMPPEVEFAGMNPLWVPLYKSMAFDTVAKILFNDFGVWTSTKAISKLKSFANFDKYVTTLLIKNKVNKIVFNNDEPVLRQNLSNTMISAQDAESIKQSIQKVFNITVDYDISETTLGNLYRYIYKKTSASQELRYQLFGKTYNEPRPFELQIPLKELQELRRRLFGKTYIEPHQGTPNNIITRADIFAGIIHRVNSAVLLRPCINGHTNIRALENAVCKNPQKYDALQTVFNDLKSIGAEIDTSDEHLRLHDICDQVHNILIERGASVSTRISREDMDPTWSAINLTIIFNRLKSILEYDMDINISMDKLMNCKTYYDYEKLISAAQMRKATKQVK